jgi:hypothetical protein
MQNYLINKMLFKNKSKGQGCSSVVGPGWVPSPASPKQNKTKTKTDFKKRKKAFTSSINLYTLITTEYFSSQNKFFLIQK